MLQFPERKSMFEPYVGATGKINNAVEEVVKEQEGGEDEEEDKVEEEGENGGEEYSDNFEDAQSLDTEQTGEPQRPSAPVCHT